MFLNVLLARHQVPTDAVSVTTIGAGPTAIAAMERGMVAAGWLADPSFTLVHSRNPGVRVLADLRNEAGTLAAFGTSTYPGAVLYANAAWLDSHRTVAAGLAGAIVRTLEWMHAHSATEIAAQPPIAVMQIKEIVNAGLNAPLDTALMLERKALLLQFATQDQKEGMRAFLEKRKPSWQ